jgi:hypothetical protein
MNSAPLSGSEDRAVALAIALKQTYAAIHQTKRLVREQGSRPAGIIRQLNDIQAQLDAVYTETGLQEMALHDVTLIAQELRRAYDELVNDAETAYQSGWHDALKQALESDSAWRVARVGRGNRVDRGSAAVSGSE